MPLCAREWEVVSWGCDLSYEYLRGLAVVVVDVVAGSRS